MKKISLFTVLVFTLIINLSLSIGIGTAAQSSKDIFAIGEILINEGSYVKSFNVSDAENEIVRLSNELLNHPESKAKELEIEDFEITGATIDTIIAVVDCSYKLFGKKQYFSLDIEAKLKGVNSEEDNYRLYQSACAGPHSGTNNHEPMR